jgi:hypothetical protein
VPTYCYRDDATGESVEQVHPASDIPESVTVEGQVFKRDRFAEMVTQSRQMGHKRTVRKHNHGPVESDAMGCHPSQIPEMRAAAAKKGLKVDFDPKYGTAKFATRKQYKEYAEAHGMYARNGGYSDPQPGAGKVRE